MSDIVERLRLLVPSDSSGAAIKAIDEITRLRSEVERLKEALNQAGCDHCSHWFDRAALEEKP